mmetsp:Transcript_114600/g.356919  ORF Transcript_114600/g.356919 Transcript_114600/m.356919 type:complete len:335 (-) Transcript_114600:59-1063(-)
MLASAFHFHRFGVAVAVGLLAELGDKTFFLLLVLSLWCPWQGLRDSKAVPFERFLVFAGASVALLARLIVLAYWPYLESVDCWFDVASGALFFLLGLRAVVERRLAEPEPEEEQPPADKEKTEEAPQEPAATDPKWNQLAFSWLPSVPTPKNPFAADEPADEPAPAAQQWNKTAFPTAPTPEDDQERAASPGYGTMDAPPTSANGVLSERMSDSLASRIMAGPLACVLTFVLQADDRSEEALLDFGRFHVSSVLGAWTGLMLAAAAAVIAGRVLRWAFFQKRQALVAVILVLFSLGLVCFSQAIAHVPGLRPPQPLQPATVVAGVQANGTTGSP